MSMIRALSALTLMAALCGHGTAHAQEESAAETCLPKIFPPIATYASAEVTSEGRVIFRHCDPDANEVSVISNEMPTPQGAPPAMQMELPMQQDDSGMWSTTYPDPLPPANYSYSFRVNGQEIGDPRATGWSLNWSGARPFVAIRTDEPSLVSWDADIEHGVVSEVTYWSEPTGLMRQAMVYTPPGYMTGSDDYPVLYLVHGAGGSHHTWLTQGSANLILDNLIARGEIQPMIVVMPHGHPPALPGVNVLDQPFFGRDMHGALIPFIDSHFRTIAEPSSRAMAGLSMGAGHTLDFGLPRSDVFEYVGIFSMGIGYAFDAQGLRLDEDHMRDYANKHEAGLRRTAQDMQLVYFGMGTEDFLHFSAEPLIRVLNQFGIEHVYNESGGGHSWANWRDYLVDFAPRLFNEKPHTVSAP